jgi:hypothetical protein
MSSNVVPRVIRQVAVDLEAWIEAENHERREYGGMLLRRCTIRVLGQTALLETGLPSITLANTRDVDVYANYEWPVQREFARLLKAQGRELDPVGHEAWMPQSTKYLPLYNGYYVEALIAEPEAVLISKAIKAPVKNRQLLLQYIAHGPSARFLELAAQNNVDLKSIQ